MPTLEDLRELLESRAADCADIAITVPTRSKGRFTQPLLAAAAVLAAVVGSVVFLSPGHEPTPTGGTAAYPSADVRWQFKIGSVPNWASTRSSALWATDGSNSAGAWGEGATLTPVSGRSRLFYGFQPKGVGQFPGNGVGSQLQRAEAVTVHGQSGWFVPGARVETAEATGDPWKAAQASGDWQPQLVWRNGDGSWSSLSGTVGFRPATLDFDNKVAKRVMLQVARAVKLTPAGDRVTMPFAVADARLRPIEIGTVRGVSCIAWASRKAPLPYNNASVTMCRAPNDKLSEPNVPKDGAITRDLGDGSTLVVGNLNGGVDTATARDLLAAADVTPKLTDPSTWLPVS